VTEDYVTAHVKKEALWCDSCAGQPTCLWSLRASDIRTSEEWPCKYCLILADN
jgi:hypothetical protein